MRRSESILTTAFGIPTQHGLGRPKVIVRYNFKEKASKLQLDSVKQRHETKLILRLHAPTAHLNTTWVPGYENPSPTQRPGFLSIPGWTYCLHRHFRIAAKFQCGCSALHIQGQQQASQNQMLPRAFGIPSQHGRTVKQRKNKTHSICGRFFLWRLFFFSSAADSQAPDAQRCIVRFLSWTEREARQNSEQG